MAFKNNRFVRQTVGYNSGQITTKLNPASADVLVNGPAMYTYASADDAIATIAAANYFAPVVTQLAVNDRIDITGSDASGIYIVSAVDKDAETVSIVSYSASATVGTANITDGAVTTAKLADDAVTSAKLAEDTIQTVTVTASTAELLALATTPKELVAAPGADKVIQFLGATLVLDYNSVAYTESGDNMAIKYENASGVQVSEAIESTGFIDQTADTLTNAIPVKDAIVAASGCVNKALVLDNLGSNFAAGDSPMDVIVSYKIVTAGL